MNRNEFLKTCGVTCFGAVGLSLGLSSCSRVYSVQGRVADKSILVDKSAFVEIKKSGEKINHDYLVVNVENLKFPIVVYADGKEKYTALWLKCTHQGNEVTVHGDILSCSAHGSEYDRTGKVIEGPAKENLRSFPIRSDETTIYIQLV